MATEPTPQPHFGRIIAPDDRDRNFPMRMMLDPLRTQFFPTGLPDGSRHYFSGPVLDQGVTGTCVAHGWASKIHAAPFMQPIPMSVFDLYRRIVVVDEWPENDFESGAPDNQLQSGTSVRAGAKILTNLGLAQSYLWAQSAEDVRSWILAGFGGVVIGIWWKNAMMQTDSEGFISYTGSNAGGHCVYINGWNDRVKRGGKYVRAARIQNSWGKQWGQSGRCWFEMSELDAAIKEDGEACALTEIRLAPRK